VDVLFETPDVARESFCSWDWCVPLRFLQRKVR